jgi:hypothetical protein
MLGAVNASACSFPLVSLDRHVEDAEQIFIATLLEAKVMPRDGDHQWPWIQGRFHVSKRLKGGPETADVTLMTGMVRGDCSIGMLVSAKYLVFKNISDTGIGADTGTQIIEDFQEEEFTSKIFAMVKRKNIQPQQK